MEALTPMPQTISNTELTALREHFDKRMRNVQLEAIRVFSDYAHSVNLRFQKLEPTINNLNVSTSARLGELERQMMELRVHLMSFESQRPGPPQ
jgi:hypothetical protein